METIPVDEKTLDQKPQKKISRPQPVQAQKKKKKVKLKKD